MSILSGLFRSRDKPTNSTNGSTYRFLFVNITVRQSRQSGVARATCPD